ncbi:MAG: acetyl-CoA carboxylase biotin carboxylase subunit [Omnitrophica bacterium RIFCSPLOWO2_12_FULL_44_17]|uniref:Biotin carboxylase n=1 Tax=Candidatus Danuiimicrobium aquiferis TaxID=1801832 RepID=A0A1G1L2N6_9BACT|nr:MAG: acetyl-CoA carboxylase biotin carboxylase subunit [Omnitrophica bacterium RIFCSPHIGHO2_02_FULL_45_28]OGW89779.1 MAG: acetyl-CoA carboxylase biotin carboxylase subunit [Omnitrophica bacterium RIFCSPHIGHO2_12_FULL_44_12]OGW99422.1 MAG: acetyl-CoA carboxylase biotin carboxylase subunit [Omnitrophica bacterium RIFCSPLOWO2_12_FULL_44_17]OGX03034.1 MAG: acetyl-CoA carboxylase biotin carboxylase subunit [Omnitrophica bacterium RIFCSPLOWO2_02_FULL_44_11]
MFHKVLIANRGEVAVRVIRACRELDIRTVAVFSKADRDSMHVRLADEAICIGDASSQDSYLNIPSIISAAEIADVDAIHPGYGFLSENPHFAEICESCQIKFIGPKPESIRLAGDKSLARDTCRKANIPIIPGSKGIISNQAEALRIAKKFGYPVAIKAKAGGGGKGIKVAHNDGKLVNAFLTAQAEAEAAFGSPDVYMEKYVQEPRHIEIQILADSYGNVIHLGERDCSIQRRHQKLIEESPSVALDKHLRRKMGEVAIRVARAIQYENVGTVEFLLDATGRFYFMEMNTRLQVEHPVTEMITGIDMVKEQIRIAAGGKLELTQDQVEFKGAAIECRINAEDPDRNFLPCPGKIESVHFPGGRNLRVDSHIYAGYVIPPYYDSMIAKVIAHGKDRNEAIQIMLRALRELTISPIKTTVSLHEKVLNSPRFRQGKISTSFLETYLADVKSQDQAVEKKKAG